MDMSTQQQAQVEDMNQNLCEEKILSIIAAGDEIDDILHDKDTASPPMLSSIPTPTVKDSSDAGQAPAVDILAQAIALELGSLNEDMLHDDIQPTHSREVFVHQDVNVNNLQPPANPTHNKDVLIQQNGSAGNTSPPYIKMIAESILASPTKQLVLSQVYSYIEHKYPKFTGSKKLWKNGVRHNLSSNKCFKKCGQAPSGRGYIWQIHPACMQMFQCGNFLRRDALSEVHRYESENRRSVNGQQTRNGHHPQNSVVTMDTQPARMPYQDQQLQLIPVYLLPMPQVGPLNNTQGHHVGTEGQYVSIQGQDV